MLRSSSLSLPSAATTTRSIAGLSVLAANSDYWCQLIGLVVSTGILDHESFSLRISVQDDDMTAVQSITALFNGLATAISDLVVKQYSKNATGKPVWMIYHSNADVSFFVPMIERKALFDPTDDVKCREYNQAYHLSLINSEGTGK